jgi:hypothetical protein
MIFQEPVLNNGFVVIECDFEALLAISESKHCFLQKI